MTIDITNAYVAGDSLVLAGRTEDGQLVRATRLAERSLFVKVKELPNDVRRALRDHRAVRSLHIEGEWLRIVAASSVKTARGKRDAEDIRTLLMEWLGSHSIRVYEGDVHPVRRFFADTGAKVAKPRRAFVDFEADSRSGFQFHKMRTVCWTVIYEDGTDRQGVLTMDNLEGEKALLQGFWDAIADVDQVCAWNGDRFDFPFVQKRTELVGLQVVFRNWLWMDMMLAYKRLGRSGADGDEKESVALEATAQVVLGEGKTETPDWVKERFGSKKTLGQLSWELWNAGGEARQLLVEYNRRDAHLMLSIEHKIGVLAMHDAICQACQVLPDSRGLLPTQHVEGFMLRLGAEKQMHFATRARFTEEEEEEKQFKGAYVMEPQVGLAENVHVGDFSSMYPSIILTWNLSPETKDMSVPVDGEIPPGHCRAPETRIGFRTDVVGLLPLALRTMLSLRKFWADKKASLTPGTEEWIDAGRRSDGYKIAANSFYGVLGNRYSRFYDRDVAESVSTTGAWLIKQVMGESEARGWIPLYADTDSNFIGGTTREEFARFMEYLNKEAFPRWTASQGCVECHLKIAYEKQFASILFLSKKRYSGRFAHYKGKEATADSKPEVRGLEYRRGDTGRLARAFQKEVVYKVLGVGQGAILDPVFYDALIREWQKRVLDGELGADEACFSHSLSKDPDMYEARAKKGGGDSALPAHVQIAKVLRARGQNIYEGTA